MAETVTPGGSCPNCNEMGPSGPFVGMIEIDREEDPPWSTVAAVAVGTIAKSGPPVDVVLPAGVLDAELVDDVETACALEVVVVVEDCIFDVVEEEVDVVRVVVVCVDVLDDDEDEDEDDDFEVEVLVVVTIVVDDVVVVVVVDDPEDATMVSALLWTPPATA
jgi:hypothetical protein